MVLKASARVSAKYCDPTLSVASASCRVRLQRYSCMTTTRSSSVMAVQIRKSMRCDIGSSSTYPPILVARRKAGFTALPGVLPSWFAGVGTFPLPRQWMQVWPFFSPVGFPVSELLQCRQGVVSAPRTCGSASILPFRLKIGQGGKGSDDPTRQPGTRPAPSQVVHFVVGMSRISLPMMVTRGHPRLVSPSPSRAADHRAQISIRSRMSRTFCRIWPPLSRSPHKTGRARRPPRDHLPECSTINNTLVLPLSVGVRRCALLLAGIGEFLFKLLRLCRLADLVWHPSRIMTSGLNFFAILNQRN